MKDYKQIKEQLLLDKEIKVSYDDLAPEYKLIRKVIQLRLKKKMSQKDLADRIGTKQSAISRFESGNANPSVRFLQKMAKALDSELKISFQ